MASSITNSKAGFTLIEMLVVIVIISLIAGAVSIGVRSAQNQARDMQCLAHLKNLHNAATSYLADQEHYPAAGSYEICTENENEDGEGPSGGQLNYSERIGWVAWIRDGIEKTSANNPYKLDKHNTHAASFRYVGCGGASEKQSLSNKDALEKAKYVQQSIREGGLFRYTGKDYTTYFCKQSFGGSGAHRSYAMNGWFYSRRHPARELRTTRHLSDIDSSRLAMFVEIESNDGGKVKGEPYDLMKDWGYYQTLGNIVNDSVWDYDDKKEGLGCWHKKAGRQCTHVLFADGHIETILKEDDGEGDDYADDDDFLHRIRYGER